jgi:hypothetical protein
MNERAHGWATFTALFLFIIGVLNVVWGIAALSTEQNFSERGLVVFSSLETWGWIVLTIGLFELLGAALVANRHPFGVVIALIVASFGLLAHFVAIGAYPLWSVVLMVMNALVLWAATVHNDEFQPDL